MYLKLIVIFLGLSTVIGAPSTQEPIHILEPINKAAVGAEIVSLIP